MKNFSIIICAASLLCTFASCSGAHETKEDLATAEKAGHDRALSLSPDSIALHQTRGMELSENPAVQSALLDIRRRERTLRQGNHNKTADAYINSFLATLDSVNPALASQLKGE